MGWKRALRDRSKTFRYGLSKKSGAHKSKKRYNRKQKHKGQAHADV